MLAASFIKMLIFYACEFTAIVAVAVAGVFVGKALRDRKEKKKANAASEVEASVNEEVSENTEEAN